jgi:hypothetical protein
MAKDGAGCALQHHPWPWFSASLLRQSAFPAGKTIFLPLAEKSY